MIRINLLPFRAARKTENIRRQVSMFVLSLFLVFLVVFLVQIMLNKTINKLNNELDRSKKELALVKRDAKAVEDMKKKLKILQQKTDVMIELDKNRRDPVILLEEMTEMVVPNRMWFTFLDASGNNVIIKGVSLDNKTTADFMTRLENSPLFSTVILQSITQGANKLKNFGITCVKAPPKKES